MTRDVLAERIGELADAVLADRRWVRDDLSVSVLGMLLYGYAFGVGRVFMFLDVEDIDEAVLKCMTERVGAAAKWSDGLVAQAAASALDAAHHLGHHELIGVGHSYLGVEDQNAILENIYKNIQIFR